MKKEVFENLCDLWDDVLFCENQFTGETAHETKMKERVSDVFEGMQISRKSKAFGTYAILATHSLPLDRRFGFTVEVITTRYASEVFLLGYAKTEQ